MPALWISHVTVSNDEGNAAYGKLAGPAILKHGGVFLARGGRYRQLEGKEHLRQVVIRFESLEAAQACYDSPDYQAALKAGEGAFERDLVLVEIDG